MKSITDILREHGIQTPEDSDIESVRNCQVTVAEIKDLAAPSADMSDEARGAAIGLLKSVVTFSNNQVVTIPVETVLLLGGSVQEEVPKGQSRKLLKSPKLSAKPISKR